MTRPLIGILILTTAAFAGCDRQSPTATTADKAANAARTAADNKAADVKAAADDKIAADLKAAADTKAAADAKIAADLKAADDAAARLAADAKTAADATTTKANSLLTQLQTQIKDNKLALADATLAQLDGMKASLPASLQAQIETARTALGVKKSAAAQLP